MLKHYKNMNTKFKLSWIGSQAEIRAELRTTGLLDYGRRKLKKGNRRSRFHRRRFSSVENL
jgi:hypothetical protein